MLRHHHHPTANLEQTPTNTENVGDQIDPLIKTGSVVVNVVTPIYPIGRTGEDQIKLAHILVGENLATIPRDDPMDHRLIVVLYS